MLSPEGDDADSQVIKTILALVNDPRRREEKYQIAAEIREAPNTELARVVRGRFLSLREEEFVMAAELSGCSRTRIILSHMVPSFLSHIIAATTLAIPAMIFIRVDLPEPFGPTMPILASG